MPFLLLGRVRDETREAMTEGAFFALIGVAVAVFLIGGIAYRALKKYPIPLSFAEQPNLKEIVTWVQQDAEVKKRLLVTLGVLLLVGAGSFIPIPGVNVRAVFDVFREVSYSLGEERLSIIAMNLTDDTES
jgi:preprotein translocase subunit SecY